MSDVKLKFEEHEICRTVAMKYGKTVVDDSIIVPDVKPDIKKILCVTSNAYITGITPSQDKVHIEGAVKATVLYLPDGDVIGKVKSLNMSREFGHSLDIKDASADSIVSAEAEIDKTTATLINSRKVNVRLSVNLGVRVCRSESVSIPVGTDDNMQTEPPKKPDFLDLLPFKTRSEKQETKPQAKSASDKIQLKKIPIRLASNQINTDGSIIVRDQYEVPAKLPCIGEILLANVIVEPEEAVTTEGNTRLKGNLKISIMYEDSSEQSESGGTIRTAEFTVPYSEQFDTPRAVDDMECEPEYNVREVYTEIRDNQDGEAKVIGVEAVIGVNVSSCCITEQQAVADAYALGNNELKTETEEISPEQIADIKTAEITHKTTAKRSENQPEIAGVCCAQIMRTSVDDVKIEDGTATVKGSVDIKIICLTGDENQPVSAIEHTAEFENSFECENTGEGRIACDAKVFVSHCGYTISGSDAVDLRLIIGISLKMVRNDKIKIMKTIEIKECENAGSDNTRNYIIYFVQSGDTLWNIAKRYHTTVDSIVEHNNIADRDMIFPGQKIKIYA